MQHLTVWLKGFSFRFIFLICNCIFCETFSSVTFSEALILGGNHFLSEWREKWNRETNERNTKAAQKDLVLDGFEHKNLFERWKQWPDILCEFTDFYERKLNKMAYCTVRSFSPNIFFSPVNHSSELILLSLIFPITATTVEKQFFIFFRTIKINDSLFLCSNIAVTTFFACFVTNGPYKVVDLDKFNKQNMVKTNFFDLKQPKKFWIEMLYNCVQNYRTNSDSEFAFFW